MAKTRRQSFSKEGHSPERRLEQKGKLKLEVYKMETTGLGTQAP